jgi:hypothetical protein
MAEEQLHDRATRGETLSPEEHAQLEAWYAQLDRVEMATLENASTAESREALASQIGEALNQVAALTGRNPDAYERKRRLAS